MVMTQRIGVHLTNDEKRVHLTDLNDRAQVHLQWQCRPPDPETVS